MIKRAILVAGGLGLSALFVFGRDAASYVCTGVSQVKERVKDQVPLEFEIDRARKMVQGLVPDIRRNMHVIAKEEVEVERLENEIAASEERISEDRTELMRLKNDLSSDEDVFRYADRTYTRDQVKADLANRFTRYKTADATLGSLREIYEARQRSLESARQKLESMLAVKRQLEVDVENLEARLRAIDVAQTTSDYQFDDSDLSRTKDLVVDLRTRLEVAERMVNADQYFDGEIPLDDTSAENIVDQVTEYFESEPTQVASTTK